MQHPVKLPVGPHAGWELEESDDDASETPELRSIAESLVVFESLRQSRIKWLSATFPKFSAKVRGGKLPDVVPPPHTIKAHGRYDMRIGPHIFPNTAFYEVHYIPQPSNVATTSQTGASHGASNPTPQAQLSTAHLAVSALTEQAVGTTPQNSTQEFSAIVTPDMVSQVTIASESNPILKNLLHLAAAGRATPDQLKTLGLLIQSMGSSQQPEAAPIQFVQPPQQSYSSRPFDIVIEFQEKSSDRWIIPRGPIVCERVDSSSIGSRLPQVLLSLAVPFQRTSVLHAEAVLEPSTTESPSVDVPPHVVTFHLSGVSQQLWDVFVTWAGGEQGMEGSRNILREMAHKAPERAYLQYQLPDGSLLQQIQSAVAPPYNTKSIVPGNPDGPRAKRKSSSRKAGATNPPNTAQKPAPVKRKQSMKTALTAPTPIACRACGQTDVPLLMGGRYCRVCIDAGRAVADIPQLPLSSHTHKFKAVEAGPVSSGGSANQGYTGGAPAAQPAYIPPTTPSIQSDPHPTAAHLRAQ